MKIKEVLLKKCVGLWAVSLPSLPYLWDFLCGIDERAKVLVSEMQIVVLPLPLCPWAYDKSQRKDTPGYYC